LKFGQVDFKLNGHPQPMVNADRVQELEPLPKFWSEKYNLAEERLKIAEGLKGKATWNLYHKKLPLGHVPLA
jgi:hypothetical protein